MQFTPRGSQIADFPQSIKSIHRPPVKIINFFHTTRLNSSDFKQAHAQSLKSAINIKYALIKPDDTIVRTRHGNHHAHSRSCPPRAPELEHADRIGQQRGL
ncbi:MAG: hypothetical protein V4793_42360, partial [Paraburkholderia tropica]